jgi:transcriptional regulator
MPRQLLLLKTLSRGTAMHGFEILRWMRETTDGELLVEEGALYPALHRLERRGWITGEWNISEKGRRAKYYTITTAGRAELVREEKRWLKYVAAWEKIALAASTA